MADAYLMRLKKMRQHFDWEPAVQRQLAAIKASVLQLQGHELPAFGLPELGIGPDVLITDFARRTWTDAEWAAEQHWLSDCDHLLRNYRQYVEVHFGMWAYITQDVMQNWVHLFPHQHWLELMSGNGYISRGLRDQGQQVVATDSLAWTSENETGRQLETKVLPLDAVTAVQCYGPWADAIVLSWSPDGDPVDQQILAAIRSLPQPVQFFCIGEKNGATNSAGFWQQAHEQHSPRLTLLNHHYPHFDLMRDQIYWLA
ncbi:SAM-dependent methyltransferase [Lactobacillus selangorensis]|uniref:SAM-dependent methyltransferase n=1 Tax=Lactobacillus selangorensis TaxID=81857 RepID=A0A0R2FLK1_9LACO|nr:hypothetical protein [Lactobacillus selangorensis]KRN29503.1 SAM-dependent methyltransferase [Lactobacillus selangorensis]KRN33967.1 SAM-dependent methyltransferase [Lactobacillus selangorensis]